MSVGKIQATPRGFLQFLGMVGSGVPPTSMGDDVRATIDMLHFYGQGRLQRAGSTGLGAGTATGASHTHTVPTGEAWILVAGNATIGPVALNDQVRSSFRVITKDGFSVQVAQSELMVAATANAILSLGFTFPQPFMLVAGESIRVTLNDAVLAGAIDIGAYALVYQFNV